MIANPVDAIAKCNSREDLAKVLEELMKPWYPTYTNRSWELWSVKYPKLTTAKKCALSIYRRVQCK